MKSAWGKSWGYSWGRSWGDVVVITPEGIKVFLGTWQVKPMKVFNGTSWVKKPVKRWSGSQWIEVQGGA